MSLSSEVLKASFDALSKSMGSSTPQQKALLREVNDVAANHNVPLHSQSEALIQFLFRQIKAAVLSDDSKLDALAADIYRLVAAEMNKDRPAIKRMHGEHSDYDTDGIHHRKANDKLQDHDIALMMPKSTANIDVLAALDASNEGAKEAIRQGVEAAINNDHIEHILIPAGPGHWRGIYISKPVHPDTQYQVELFDPYGPKGAATINELVLVLLAKCNINRAQIKLSHSGPKIPQKDFYACGDFTCAYSHKKMKELGAAPSEYRQDLIAVLDDSGNAGGALRKKIRELSKELDPRPASSVNTRSRTQLRFGSATRIPVAKKTEPVAVAPIASSGTKNDKPTASAESYVSTFFPHETARSRRRVAVPAKTKAEPILTTMAPEALRYSSYIEAAKAHKDTTDSKLNELKRAISNVTVRYVDYSHATWFSLFHRHGQTGRLRAADFDTRFGKMQKLERACENIIQFLTDEANGNKHPHSYRTMLLNALLPEDAGRSLEFVSKNYDQLIKVLAEDLGVELKAGIDLRIR